MFLWGLRIPGFCGKKNRLLGEDFLPVLLALSRCGVCFALMSTDLKDKDPEASCASRWGGSQRTLWWVGNQEATNRAEGTV